MNKLKALREERGLTVRALGPKVGINPVSITYYENEKRDMSTDVLRKLSSFFEVTTDYLLCINNYCVYAKYDIGNYIFKIKEDYYLELKEKKYIYFDNNDNRCIDLNSLVGVNDSNNLIDLIKELVRVDKFDTLFEKKSVNNKDIEALDDEILEIELAKGFVEKIKDAIR